MEKREFGLFNCFFAGRAGIVRLLKFAVWLKQGFHDGSEATTTFPQAPFLPRHVTPNQSWLVVALPLLVLLRPLLSYFPSTVSH